MRRDFTKVDKSRHFKLMNMDGILLKESKLSKNVKYINEMKLLQRIVRPHDNLAQNSLTIEHLDIILIL